MVGWWQKILLGGVLSVGCSEPDRDGAFTSSATASGTNSATVTGDGGASGTSSTAAPSTGAAEATATGETGDAIFDVGSEPGTTTGVVPDECAKVDVLYIIDNSPSMYDEQQTLIANFPTFVMDMQDALVDVDSYHIGVITTDDFVSGGFPDDGNDSVNQSFPECQSLGGLVVEGQTGSCLPFADGGNFITDADDLATKFSCIANVGENGDSDEKVGDALITLLGSQMIANDVTNCNEGFIRDDALLVLVILTDENDSSGTNPDQWYQAVVAAKGVPENAVVLTLTWDDSANGCTSNLSETTGSEIVEFAQMFPNHSLGNICEASYAGFFSATLPLLESACEDFEPPG